MIVIFTSIIFFLSAIAELEAEPREDSDYRFPLLKNSIGRPDDLDGRRILKELESLRLAAALIPREGRSSHTLDSLSGMSFGTNKRFDSLSGSRFGLGSEKRNFDEIDRSGFNSFIKRNFDEIDRSGFNSFAKKNFDEIDRSGFNSFVKRSAEV